MIFLKFIVFTTTLIIFSNDCNLYANPSDINKTLLDETNKIVPFIVDKSGDVVPNKNQETPDSGKKDSGK